MHQMLSETSRLENNYTDREDTGLASYKIQIKHSYLLETVFRFSLGDSIMS